MADFNYMTKEGFGKLMEQLDNLKVYERAKAAKAIAEAREKGDLSENAEYDAAKDAQGMLELKINELETMLAKGRIIDESTIDTSAVSVLTIVKIKNIKNGFTVTYKLVSESESNIKEKKISVDSPIGKGLLGKKVGEVAEIQTPSGIMEFEVIEISI